MPLSTVELAKARDIVKQVLDELGLEAYLYEVEPDEHELEIKIECALKEGWERVKIPVAKELLLSLPDDSDAYQLLLKDWRSVLTACLVKSEQTE